MNKPTNGKINNNQKLPSKSSSSLTSSSLLRTILAKGIHVISGPRKFEGQAIDARGWTRRGKAAVSARKVEAGRGRDIMIEDEGGSARRAMR